MSESLTKNNHTTDKRFLSFFVLYVIITVAVYILPWAQFVLPYIPVALLMLASLPILMLNDKKWWSWGVIMLLFTALVLLANFFLNGMPITDAINEGIRNVRYFIPVLWGCWAIKKFNKRQSAIVLIVFLLIAAFICIRSLEALAKEPWVSRLLAQDRTTSSSEVNAYRLANVGGYSYSYMMGAVTVALAWLAIERVKKILPRLLCILGVVVCYYYIIQTMYMTLLLMTSVGILILLFLQIKNVFARFLFVVGTVVLAILLPNIFAFLSDVFKGSLLSSKFSDMYDALTGGGAESLGIRPQLMLESLKNWVKTPFFGGIYSTHSHSTLIGVLQDNGIFGLAFWLCIYITSWRLIRNALIYRGVDPTLFNICMIYLTAVSVFNDTRYTFEVTIAIFFVIPLLLLLLGQQEKQILENDG